jgi:exonuclease SbcC
VRPLRLEVTAFGPYASTEVVDFGALARAGLFLIHGRTGAGKSSLLDALCFALYGAVPGNRSALTRLRSDHAAPTVAPRAALDFEVSGRTWRVERAPVWDKPGRTTPTAPTALLSEWTGGAWRPVAQKKTDVDAMVRDVLGLELAQFQQVILLPQGHFQQVLRARDDERERLLRTLFGSARFHRYTDDLFGEARQLEDHVQATERAVEQAATRMVDAWTGVDLGPVPALDELAPLLDAAVDAAAAERDRSESAWAAATGRLRAVADRAGRWARRDEARAELARAEAQEGEIQRLRARMALATRAEPVRGPAAAADQLDAELTARRRVLARVERTWRRTAAGCRLPVPGWERVVERGPADREAMAALHERLLGLAARLDGLAEAAAEIEAATASAGIARGRAAAAEGAVGAAVEAESTARRQIGELGLALTHARAAATTLDALRAEADRAGAAARAADRLPALAEQARRCDGAARHAAERAIDAAQELLSLVELRVAGLSAELAGRLVDGEPCPVCGSCTHPSPHQASGPIVEAAAVAAAQRRVEETKETADRCSAEAAAAHRARDACRAQAGDPPVTHELALEARARAAAAEAAATSLPALEAERVRLEEWAATASGAATTARSEAVRFDAQARHDTQRAEVRRAEIAAVLGPGVGPGALRPIVEQALTELRAWLDAADEERRAAAALAAARTRVERTAVELGFDGADDALQALAPVEEQESGRRACHEHEWAVAHWRAVLAEAELADVGDERPDVEAASRVEEQARAERDHQRSRSERLAAAREVVAAHDVQRRRLQEELQPRRVQAQRVRRLAELCRGNGPTRASLERWVLAAFLDEICREASHRLTAMTDGRFQLRCDATRRRGNAPAGLGITISDSYTGDERDAASLSGGETFLASLALALGLADVVQHHAGGVRLDALFVDEGFGALDSDALDLALGQLDALRAGGRLVGVISHVPVLRERIGVGIEVLKTARGSTVRVGDIAAA